MATLYLLCFVALFGFVCSKGMKVIQGNDYFPPHNRCEPIRFQFCQNLKYNETIFPNLLNHVKQEEAAPHVYQFTPFVKVNCSADLKFFLCSVFAPVCTILTVPLPPCRGFCESVRQDCYEIMNRYNYTWPDYLDCNKFPDKKDNSDIPCVGYDNDTHVHKKPNRNSKVDFKKVNERDPSKLHGAKDHGFVCPTQFKVPKSLDLGYSLKVGDKLEPDCGAPCYGMFFNDQHKHFARLWIGVWSFICGLSCLFTVLTFLIDTNRFRYPERPIIFLSLCYMMVATAYVLGWMAGDYVSCQGPFNSVGGNTKYNSNKPLITQGTKHEPCTVSFMIVYFFGMASSIWWVILTLTWFMAAGLKWGHEAIEANSQYFHLAAWAVPAIKTISILAMGKVDGDILSGVCYVGIWDSEALRSFVLIPLCVYLFLGTIFLMAGFVSLFRIRTVMKHDGTKTDKLEKLMMRIGIFGVLYTVPALIVIACLFYEQANFENWMITWHRDICSLLDSTTTCPFTHKNSRPIFEVFMIKYLMTMIVGITSSFWIWSGKTLISWRQFFDRFRSQRTEAYV